MTYTYIFLILSGRFSRNLCFNRRAKIGWPTIVWKKLVSLRVWAYRILAVDVLLNLYENKEMDRTCLRDISVLLLNVPRHLSLKTD
jgi:hypothetical protein